ncbi:DUF4307 domain-containing protein [Canibacter sp. lx-45]|uniref:DUF4307 domain-containing protein n=1 Tax=Canibacter zhuwentaonis TaxID=2837491 RepID=UPI001BDBF20F|nr:DUF4307 domain-containing protein [Canibacter zhuwentaonis]
MLLSDQAAEGADQPPACTTVAPHLADRYGARASRKRDRALAWVLGAMLVVSLGWFTYAMVFRNSFGNISVADISHSVIDKHTAKITFDVTTARPQTKLRCEIQALSTSYAPLGYKIIELPASSKQHQRITTELRTLNTANTVTATDCWEVP